MLENAKTNVKFAREKLDSSIEEVKGVKVLLKEADERWEVICVNGLSAAAAPSKRRKVLVSPSVGVDTGVLQNNCPPGSRDMVCKNHHDNTMTTTRIGIRLMMRRRTTTAARQKALTY